jgi:hypothetical protein
MSEYLQPGQHPDADQIGAFVEHALPAHERERIFDHLAVCPECRAIVARSLPPVDEPAKLLAEPARGRWLSGWNLAWSTAVVLAATIFFTIFVYHAATPRSAPGQLAVSRPAPSTAAATRPSEPMPARVTNPQPIHGRGVNPKDKAAAATPLSAAPAEKPRTIAAAPIAGHSLTTLTAPSVVASENLKSVNALRAAKKEAEAKTIKPSIVFGVADTEGQPGTLLQKPLSPGGFQSDHKIVAGASAAPEAQAAAPSRPALPPAAAPGTSNEIVALKGAAPTVIASSEPAAAPAQAEEPVLQLQRPEHRLPSRLPVVSMAAHERLVLAIDTHNAVFMSYDAGKHWKAVRAPWSGRAVKAALLFSANARVPASGSMQVGVAGALISGNTSFARSANSRLSGMVTDATGAVIPGASVVVSNSTSRAARAVKTDSRGRYLVDGLAPGAYDIKAAAPDFKTTQLAGVTVAASGESVVNLSLPVGAATQTVMVTAAPPAAPMDSLSATAKPSAQAPPGGEIPVLFEVTTDSGERWTSGDGLTWTRK